MNITSSGFGGRCLSYVMPIVLLGILVNLELNRESKEAPAVFKIETQVKGKIFPANWYNPPVNASATGLKAEYCPETIAEVKAVVKKYPEHLIKDNLEMVYLLDDLQMYGHSSGSVNSDKNVYICRPNWNQCTKSAIEKHFHSRFNRILTKNYHDKLDASNWTSINPAGFEYGEDKDIKPGDAELSTGDFENGFVCHYAKHNLEADFAMVSTFILSGNTEVWNLAKRYPRIERKIEQVIAFYQSLDPKMDRNFFISLTKDEEPCHG